MWQYEGDFTLYDLMQKKDWPYNLEPLLLGRELDLPRSPRRRWATLRLVMQQARGFCCLALKSESSAEHSLLLPCRVPSPLGMPVASVWGCEGAGSMVCLGQSCMHVTSACTRTCVHAPQACEPCAPHVRAPRPVFFRSILCP